MPWFPLAYEEAPIGKPPQNGAPGVGTILLLLDESSDMSAVVLALKVRGFRPVMMPVAEDAMEIVSRWEPQAVVLRAGLPDWLALLRFLGRRGVPLRADRHQRAAPER